MTQSVYKQGMELAQSLLAKAYSPECLTEVAPALDEDFTGLAEADTALGRAVELFRKVSAFPAVAATAIKSHLSG